MNTLVPPTYGACARAAMKGWFPASLFFAVLLALDGVGPSLLLGPLRIEQAVYFGVLVAAAGFIVGPPMGLLIGMPLLIASCRYGLFPTRWYAVVGSGVGAGATALVARSLPHETIPLAAVCAIVAYLCSSLTIHALQDDLQRPHAA